MEDEDNSYEYVENGNWIRWSGRNRFKKYNASVIYLYIGLFILDNTTSGYEIPILPFAEWI